MDKILHTLSAFDVKLKKNNTFTNYVFQNIDFTKKSINWNNLKFKNTIFLGCKLTKKDFIQLIEKGVFIYPKFKNLPYNPYRKDLYSWQELIQPSSKLDYLTLDYEIYNHFKKTKNNPSIHEALAQRIHDNFIDKSLKNLLFFNNNGMTQKKAIGFMGGHAIARGNSYYNKIVFCAKLIAEKGYYVISGGGPGIMEAANLGAYLAGKNKAEVLEAISLLKKAPLYTSENYFNQAQKVLKLFPKGNNNLAIPTWFYGHEPSNLFASHIAKYFSNSIREDNLLSMCLYGIIFAPGSAGTTQEIFQDATQNHYGTHGYISPMIFLGKKRYKEDTYIYALLQQLAEKMEYKKMLFLTDSVEEIAQFILEHPPIKIN